MIQKVEEICHCQDPRFFDKFSYNGTYFDGPWCDVTVGSELRILIPPEVIGMRLNENVKFLEQVMTTYALMS